MKETILAVLVVAVIAVLVVCYTRIKGKRNLRKAESGEDLDKLKNLVAKALPGESGCQVAYAHWEKVERMGRSTRTTYYCYALAFDAERLFVIPLTFDEDDDAVCHDPVLLTKEALGIAQVNVSHKSRSDEIERVAVTLYGKDGKEFVNLYVDAENTKEDRYHHVNILQPQVCQQFGRFMEHMSHQVKQENAGLEERVADDALLKYYRSVKIAAIIGIVCSFFLSGMGLILGLATLVMVLMSQKGVQSDAVRKQYNTALILSVAALAAGAVFTAVYAFALLG